MEKIQNAGDVNVVSNINANPTNKNVKGRIDRISHCITNDNNTLPACAEFTQPGDFSERSCTFHGSKIIINSHIKNVIHLIHSPASCAYYSWDYRPNTYSYCFTTDLKEEDVVFGGEKKLYNAILKICEEFNPDAIFVYETCQSALIGDDISAVVKSVKKKLNKDNNANKNIPILAFECAGFKGKTQNKGHMIANKKLFELIATKELETITTTTPTPYDINIIGDFSTGSSRSIEEIFNKMGIRVLCSFTGDATIDKIRIMDNAKLNIVHCMKSSIQFANMMEKVYEVPYIVSNFFGIKNCCDALEVVGKILNIDKKLVDDTIDYYLKKNKNELEYYKKELKGKKVFICHGAQRALNYMGPIMEELGMEVVGVATYFANKENYEKIVKQLPKGAIIIDNPNTYELESALMDCKPDIFISDSKTKELVHKLGIPYINGRAPSTVYIGFDGFINFAKDVHGAINSKIWKLVK